MFGTKTRPCLEARRSEIEVTKSHFFIGVLEKRAFYVFGGQWRPDWQKPATVDRRHPFVIPSR